MLTNGLGTLLDEEIRGRQRFIDLFCGSAAVAWHVAQRYNVETVAYDLQRYSTVLAAAVLSRIGPVEVSAVWDRWADAAHKRVSQHAIPRYKKLTPRKVLELRKWCSEQPSSLVSAYGGHYYSPEQALWIQSLRATLPKAPVHRSICLAALVIAASKTAASPGHTAQPFQPTETALQYLEHSWSRDIRPVLRAALEELASMHARVVGSALIGDANKVAASARSQDLVFVDPPYSGVQYSRFYHVLESIAAGSAGAVSGVGRYPAPNKRPKSSFSLKSEARSAMRGLLEILASRRATVVVTFPDHLCSNGLSGEDLRQISKEYFRVDERLVKSVFSTLGGAGFDMAGSRKARQHADELILCLRPS